MMTTAKSEVFNETDSLGYGQLFAALWHRRLWFSIVFLSVIAAAIPLVLNKQPTYQSSFRLLVEPNYKDETPSAPLKDTNTQVDYTTQLQLMRSSALIQKVVNRLKNDYPTLSVEEIQKTLSLLQVNEKETETKIFEATYINSDPVKTQKVLDTLKSVYQEYNLEQQEKRLSNGLSFLNQELPSARGSLLKAEEALKTFRRQHDIIEPEPEASAVAGLLRQVEQEREALSAQSREMQSQYDSLQRQANQTSEQVLDQARLSQSSRYQNLLNQIQQIEIQLSEQRVKFTEAYPTIQELLEQKNILLNLLRQEAERSIGALPPQFAAEQALLKAGQLGKIDQDIAANLIATQSNLLALQARDQTLAETENKLTQQLSRFPELIAQYNILKQEVEVKRATLQSLLEAKQRVGIELNRGGYNWQVVEPPRLGEQIGPNLLKDLLLSGVIALFAGGLVVFLLEAVDDAIRTSEQLKQRGFPPLLGVIPKWQSSVSNVFQNLPRFLASDTQSIMLPLIHWQPFRESLDLAYKNLQLRNANASLNSIVVTSPLEGEGKTTLTLGLAFSASRVRHKVLVIDANFRQPSLHQLFGLPNESGLSSLIAHETEKANIHTLSLWDATIDILTAGPIPQDPVHLLASPRLGRLVREFEQQYDLVLLDTSATLGIVDAIQSASHVRGVLLVGSLDRVTQAAFSKAIESLNQFNLLGLVANCARQAKDCQSLAWLPEHRSSQQDAA